MRWLTIAQRVELIEAALQDRVEAVAAKGAELVVSSWLLKKEACNGDVLALLRALDLVSHKKAATLALGAVVWHAEHGEKSTAGLLEKAAAVWAGGPAEAVRCLRALLESLKASSVEKAAEKAAEKAPELPPMCTALTNAAAKCLKAEGATSAPACAAALAELARVAAFCDMSNEHGRAELVRVCKELLQTLSTPEVALAPLFAALRAAYEEGNGEATAAEATVTLGADFHAEVLELISEVESPLEEEDCDDADAEARMRREQELLVAQGRLAELHSAVEEAIQGDDLDEAAKLREQAAEVQP